MAKRDVSGVISAEARSAYRHPRRMTLASRQIEHIPHNHIFVGVVRAHPIGRMNFFIIKTVEIDRVRTVNGDSSRIDVISDRTDQTEILVLIITAERRRKQNQGKTAPVAEGEHFKLAAKPWRVPLQMTFVHRRATIRRTDD